jgi:hypothetical protein
VSGPHLGHLGLVQEKVQQQQGRQPEGRALRPAGTHLVTGAARKLLARALGADTLPARCTWACMVVCMAGG